MNKNMLMSLLENADLREGVFRYDKVRREYQSKKSNSFSIPSVAQAGARAAGVVGGAAVGGKLAHVALKARSAAKTRKLTFLRRLMGATHKPGALGKAAAVAGVVGGGIGGYKLAKKLTGANRHRFNSKSSYRLKYKRDK